MIKVVCSKCKRELDELGALLFSPPDKDGKVKKEHICVQCYRQLVEDKDDMSSNE